MDKYNFLKNELLEAGQDLSALLSDVKAVPGISDSLDGWEKACDDILSHLSKDIIRVAVVGAIKSGKSTFVNSLFKGDYLKRGAGVVTSIVTKIRRGDSLNATLHFKSWEEVNKEMAQAMILLPSLNRDTGNGDCFDIRQKEKREKLRGTLSNLNTEHLISNGARNRNSVLLDSYLNGYEKVEDILGSDMLTLRYEESRFGAHRDFTGNDALSVYLRDIHLEISTGADIDRTVEIADCQGSDSPNPLHLAMIQDYLLQTHLIIYVISSRTGLRQADIRFLSIIRKMGIMDNILFVFNFDFSEHESPEELHALLEKLKTEISLIRPNPEIHTLSALFNLFKSGKANIRLSEKDRQRLAQWKKEKELSALSDRETGLFISCLNRKLTKERCSLLLKNQLERLRLISSGTTHRISVCTDMLSRDARGAGEIAEKIKYHRKKMLQIKSMTESTLDGMIKKMRQNLRADIDSFFDNMPGKILGETLRFVRDYGIPYHRYEEDSDISDFPNVLYLIFQEFREAVDMFMTESVNPDIIRFVRDREKKIREQLESVTSPYDVMLQNALAEYNRDMEYFGISPIQRHLHRIELPDTELVKRTVALKFPRLAAPVRYSAKIKTEAIIRFSFHTAFRTFKKLLRVKVPDNDNNKMSSALKVSVSRMKEETGGAVLFHFKDYRENIKFQYVFKLADAFSDILRDILLSHFQAYVSNLSEITELITRKRTDREKASEILRQMESAAGEISRKIERLREEMESCSETG